MPHGCAVQLFQQTFDRASSRHRQIVRPLKRHRCVTSLVILTEQVCLGLYIPVPTGGRSEFGRVHTPAQVVQVDAHDVIKAAHALQTGLQRAPPHHHLFGVPQHALWLYPVLLAGRRLVTTSHIRLSCLSSCTLTHQTLPALSAKVKESHTLRGNITSASRSERISSCAACQDQLHGSGACPPSMLPLCRSQHQNAEVRTTESQTAPVRMQLNFTAGAGRLTQGCPA